MQVASWEYKGWKALEYAASGPERPCFTKPCFFTWALGTKLRLLCSQGKHFIT